MDGLCALGLPPPAPLGHVQADTERLRHLLWNRRHEKARKALGRTASWTKDAAVPGEPAMEARTKRLAARCAELQACVGGNKDALVDHGRRHRAGKPVSTPRAGAPSTGRRVPA